MICEAKSLWNHKQHSNTFWVFWGKQHLWESCCHWRWSRYRDVYFLWKHLFVFIPEITLEYPVDKWNGWLYSHFYCGRCGRCICLDSITLAVWTDTHIVLKTHSLQLYLLMGWERTSLWRCKHYYIQQFHSSVISTVIFYSPLFLGSSILDSLWVVKVAPLSIFCGGATGRPRIKNCKKLENAFIYWPSNSDQKLWTTFWGSEGKVQQLNAGIILL